MEKLTAAIGLLLGIVFTPGVQGESCPSCIHVVYSISGLPRLNETTIESGLDAVFSKLNLTNPKCMSGNVAVRTCPAPTKPLVNKCQETQLTVNAKGLSGFDTAEMQATVWIRSCISKIRGESDKCKNLNKVDQATKNRIMAQMAVIGRQWSSASYSGRVCTSKPR